MGKKKYKKGNSKGNKREKTSRAEKCIGNYKYTLTDKQQAGKQKKKINRRG